MLLQPWRVQRGEKFGNARLGHPFSLVSGARSAVEILLLQPWRAQRRENFAFASLELLQKNTKGERHFDTKHNGIAKKSLQKAFFGIFFQKLDPRGHFFSLCKTAHFIINMCNFSARGKFFAPRLPGQFFRRTCISNYYSSG